MLGCDWGGDDDVGEDSSFSLADPCCPFFSSPLHLSDYLENRADFPARWK